MNITLDNKSVRRIDQNGFMHVATSNISKETVNPYLGNEIPHHAALGLDPFRVYHVYRKGSELAKGAKSFAHMPLLRNHHADSAENPQIEHRVGSIGSNPVFCTPYLQASLCITDAEAIKKIQNGQRVELSAAYFYTPVLEHGIFEGQAYDIVMTDIRANHVALVEEGRAGPDVLVADEKLQEPQQDTTNNTSPHRAKHESQSAVLTKNIAQPVAPDATQSDCLAAPHMHMAANMHKGEHAKTAPHMHTAANVHTKTQGESLLQKNQQTEQSLEQLKQAEPTMPQSKTQAQDNENTVKIEDLMAMLDQKMGQNLDTAFLQTIKDCIFAVLPSTDGATVEQMVDQTVGQMPAQTDQASDIIKSMEDMVADSKEQSSRFNLALPDDDTKSSISFDGASYKAKIIQDIHKKNQAARVVQSLIGHVDIMAFDSAEDIYLKACELKGIKANHQSARDVVHAVKASIEQSLGTTINPIYDCRFTSTFPKNMNQANNVSTQNSIFFNHQQKSRFA